MRTEIRYSRYRLARGLIVFQGIPFIGIYILLSVHNGNMKVDAPFVAQVAMLLGIVMYCVTMIGLISAIRQGTLFSVEDSGIIRVIHSFYYRQAVAPKGSVIEFDGKKITITPALQDLGFMFMKGEYSEINVPSTITEKRNPFVIIVK